MRECVWEVHGGTMVVGWKTDLPALTGFASGNQIAP
jgi:hypothetical protein